MGIKIVPVATGYDRKLVVHFQKEGFVWTLEGSKTLVAQSYANLHISSEKCTNIQCYNDQHNTVFVYINKPLQDTIIPLLPGASIYYIQKVHNMLMQMKGTKEIKISGPDNKPFIMLLKILSRVLVATTKTLVHFHFKHTIYTIRASTRDLAHVICIV